MRRSTARNLWMVAALAGTASCTAFLGLDDKPFTGTGTTAGGGDTTATTVTTVTTATTGSGGMGGTGGTTTVTTVTTSTTGSGGMGGTTTSTSTTGGTGVLGGTPPSTPPTTTTGRGVWGGTGGTGGMGAGGGDVLWAVGSTGMGGHVLGVVAVSGNGTIWVVGGFANSIALPGCAQIFTTAARAVFWAKLSPAGVCLSLRGMGGSIGGVQGDFATGLAIALDANNVPAIAGSFRGTLTDPQNPGMPLVSAAMSQDMFVARLDPSDGHVTSKAGYGGVQEDQILGLVFDDGGELYAGGSFKGSVTIPTMPPTTLNSIDPNNLDGVLIRFSSGGTPQWAKRLSGNLHATVIRALTFISSSQAIAFTGLSGGDVTGVCSWPSAGIGTADVFHAAVDKMGNCTYGVPAGANNSAGAYAIDSDSMGRMVSAGEVKGSVNLGPNPPISSPGNDTNGFVARVDWNHGPAVHAVATFGNGGGAGAVDQAFGLTIDKSNFIDVTGSFFNSVSFSGKGVQGQGLLDAFVARYDAATLGITWVRSFGDGASQQGKSVAADPVDNAIVAGGVFQGTLAGAGPSPPVASPGFPDIFVMKLAP